MSRHEHLKKVRVPMSVEEFVTTRPKKGRRGSPRIPAGTTLYAIRYCGVTESGYFTYSYASRSDAEDVMQRMRDEGTDNAYYHPWNHVADVQDTRHVASRVS